MGYSLCKIDYDLCMGDRNCKKLCPKICGFEEDQMQARVKADEIPAHLKGLFRHVAAECAPSAIIVED